MLVLLQYLPSIISLNKMLSQQFSGKLSYQLTERWTVKDFCNHLRDDKDIQPNSEVISNFQEMVDNFLLVWKLVQEHPRCKYPYVVLTILYCFENAATLVAFWNLHKTTWVWPIESCWFSFSFPTVLQSLLPHWRWNVSTDTAWDFTIIIWFFVVTQASSRMTQIWTENHCWSTSWIVNIQRMKTTWESWSGSCVMHTTEYWKNHSLLLMTG